jgi:hypothetical protein
MAEIPTWHGPTCATVQQQLLARMEEQFDKSREYTDRQIDQMGGLIERAIGSMEAVSHEVRTISEQVVTLVSEIKHMRELNENQVAHHKEHIDTLLERAEINHQGISALRNDLDSHIAANLEQQRAAEHALRQGQWWVGIIFTLGTLVMGVAGYFVKLYFDTTATQLQQLLTK